MAFCCVWCSVASRPVGRRGRSVSLSVLCFSDGCCSDGCFFDGCFSGGCFFGFWGVVFAGVFQFGDQFCDQFVDQLVGQFAVVDQCGSSVATDCGVVDV